MNSRLDELFTVLDEIHISLHDAKLDIYQATGYTDETKTLDMIESHISKALELVERLENKQAPVVKVDTGQLLSEQMKAFLQEMRDEDSN